MTVSSHDLAADLAGRLNEAIPASLSLRSKAGTIEVCSNGQTVGGSPALKIIDDNDGRSRSERIETATRAALSGIQDVIIENIRGPWPGQPSHGAEFPKPDCRVVGDELLAWCGDEADPALPLSPIRLN